MTNMPEEDRGEGALVIFGRDVGRIPCFRNTFMYSISGGIGSGLLYFLFTSKSRMATHVGFGTFFSITVVYWIRCRYQYAKDKFVMQQLYNAMTTQQMYEGTEVEERIKAMMRDGKLLVEDNVPTPDKKC